MVMVLGYLKIHSSIAVLLLHCYELVLQWVIWTVHEAWWVLWWLISLLTLRGLWWRRDVMHWLTCGLGRGSPASDSLTLSRWSSAVTSAIAGPNPLHDWIDCGCCLHGLLWCTRRWTPIPGSEDWSIRYSTAQAQVEPGMSAANALGFYEITIVWWDEWWDSLLVCVIYLLVSGGFLHLLAATMYHCYDAVFVSICF